MRSDGAIASVAAALATVDHPWPDTIVAHTSGAKTAAALASSGLVALLAVVEEVFSALNRDPETLGSALSLVEPLIGQTLEDLHQGTLEDVLTGPVARGDEDTIRAHLDALTDETPHLVPLYAALSTEMVRVAVRGGPLSPAQAGRLPDMLRTAADTATDTSYENSVYTLHF